MLALIPHIPSAFLMSFIQFLVSRPPSFCIRIRVNDRVDVLLLSTLLALDSCTEMRRIKGNRDIDLSVGS